LLNKTGPTPPSLLASWALKKVSDDGDGADDLRSSSGFIKELKSQNKPAHVPYYLLAGFNQITGQAEKSVWTRAVNKMEQSAEAVADFLFSDQNDLVISVRSMKSISGDNLEKVEVPCNHFEYFSTEQAQKQLLAWLGMT
jgi:hypothetical protein